MNTTLTEIDSLIASVERRFERRVGEAKALAEQGRRAKALADDAQATEAACEEAVVFLNSFADERQEKVQRQIEELVTHGVQTIFGEDLTFHVTSEQKANRTEVTFSLRSTMGDPRDGQVVETPILDARGGGVASVVGFLLRLIVTLLRNDRPLLVLDETFAQLSAEYEPRLAEFLHELVDQTGVQILMVTHSEAFSEHADRVYRFGQHHGVTTVSAEGGTDTSAE